MHDTITMTLRNAGVSYHVYHHADLQMKICTPQDFAAAIGCEISRITKSVFLRGYSNSTAYVMAVCSVDRRIKTKTLANALNYKRVELATIAELDEIIGYPPTSVSPLGIEGISVALDPMLLDFETIFVGGGEIGVEVELCPSDLQELTGAVLLPFTD